MVAALLYVCCRGPAATADCDAGAVDLQARVAAVIDGDTIRLENGAHLRLIGIDTPELGRDGAPDQPGARIALRFLEHLLRAEPAVGLVFDRERHDSYGRLLAHLVGTDGANIQERILASGHAVPLVVPPNTRLSDCYAAAAARAMAAGAGLWARPEYALRAAGALDPATRGYRVVRGRVQRIGTGGDALWLNLTPGFAVRIRRSDLRWFEAFDPRRLEGQWLVARGMVYKRNGQLRMTIRHPTDLKLEDR